MNRRTALKTLLGTLAYAVPASAQSCRPHVRNFGAVRSRNSYNPPRFYQEYGIFRGISTNRDVLLWKHLEKVKNEELKPYYQGPVDENTPGEGDCVAQAGGMGANICAAVNISLFGLNEKYIADASVEMLYAGTRHEIGKDLFKGHAGSQGEWFVEYVKSYGILHRQYYRSGDNEIDLRGYSPERSRKYRDVGVPDWLEPYAREHPIRETTKVSSGREALDAVGAGQPVLICSDYAVENVRDANGFSRIIRGGRRRQRFWNGWRWNWGWFDSRERWQHAWILIGALASGGGVILNSHGKWNSGPRPNGMPEGSFNITEEDLDTMIKVWDDSHALASYKGHEAHIRKHRLY